MAAVSWLRIGTEGCVNRSRRDPEACPACASLRDPLPGLVAVSLGLRLHCSCLQEGRCPGGSGLSLVSASQELGPDCAVCCDGSPAGSARCRTQPRGSGCAAILWPPGCQSWVLRDDPERVHGPLNCPGHCPLPCGLSRTLSPVTCRGPVMALWLYLLWGSGDASSRGSCGRSGLAAGRSAGLRSCQETEDRSRSVGSGSWVSRLFPRHFCSCLVTDSSEWLGSRAQRGSVLVGRTRGVPCFRQLNAGRDTDSQVILFPCV